MHTDIKPGDIVTALEFGEIKEYKVLSVGRDIVRVVHIKSGLSSFKFTKNIHKKGDIK